MRDYALGIDIEKSNDEERKAEIEKLRREEKKGLFVRHNVKRKLKLVLGLVLRRTVLNLKKRKKKKKKKTGLCLLLLLKNGKEGFKRPWDEPGRRRTLKK